MRKNNGFTVIELVVVIAVVALLVAILIPSTSNPHVTSRITVCMMNQKQLIIGWHMYACDNDGKIVSGWPGMNGGQMGWVDDPVDMSIEAKEDAIKRGVLFPYIGMDDYDLRSYRCRADQRNVAVEKSAYRSYSIVNCMNGKDEVEKSIGGGVCTTNIESIKEPAGKYVFVEQMDLNGYNGEAWSMYLDKPRWISPLAIWHRDASVMSFADGHVEKHQWERDKVLIDMFEKAKAGNADFFTAEGIATAAGNPAWEYMKSGWNVIE